MVDILRTGLSGLVASQRALATTSHNIANVNTPGYSRQRAELTTNRAEFAGGNGRSLYIGTGVNVQSITRVYDDFLTQQVRNHGTNVGQSETMSTWISQLDGVVGDSDTGLAPALEQFFGAVHDAANNPASLPARQALLGQANNLAARFQAMDGQMDTLRAGVNDSVRTTVTEINALAGNIAKINGQIALTQGQGGASADLLDQRNQLVADLAQRVPVSTVAQDDGTLSVFVGKGQSLVLGTEARALETAPATDPRQLEIRFQGSRADVNDFLNGGRIGGLLEFQNKVLDPAQNRLGLMAVGLAETFNAQHGQGIDLTGAPGGDFFTSATARTMPAPDNAGSGVAAVSLTPGGTSALQPSDYEVSYTGTGYSVRRLSDDTEVSTGAGPTFSGVDGLDITISGSPVAGDRFLVQLTGNAAGNVQVNISDPRQFAAADAAGGVGNNANALKLAGLQTDKTLLNGSSNFQDLQGQMVADIGIAGSATNRALDAQTALLDQATQARDSFSGVNLDEEAANLMRYQQSYAAAAKVVQIGDSIIQTLLDAVRR
jgi:flagellar hook-associated protein 1 FlgK